MPRGSKPGERRGGRQRGTPNKKTALANAVLCAAAVNPDASPLDFLLGLVRDRNVPIDLRIEMAAAAAPFVHLKPQRPGGKPSAVRQGLAGKVSNSSAQKVQATLSAGAGGGPGSPEPSPLEFLLAVMHDPYAVPRQRIRAARLAAPYLHRPPDPAEMPIVINDPFGFDVDPVLERALRDDWWRAYRLLQERISQKNTLNDAEASAEELDLQARTAERIKTLRCPEGYGGKEAGKDENRLHSLFCKRISPPPYNVLTELEDAEEAHLRTRVAVYKTSPEGQDRSRWRELTLQSFGDGLSVSEQREYEELESRTARKRAKS